MCAIPCLSPFEWLSTPRAPAASERISFPLTLWGGRSWAVTAAPAPLPLQDRFRSLAFLRCSCGLFPSSALLPPLLCQWY
jgi:hypothetical protein